MNNLRNTSVLILIAFALLSVYFGGYALYVSAFSGPAQGPGSGGGVIASDVSNNIAIGTSTTQSNVKFLIVASSTNSSEFSFKVLQPNGNPIFVERNDGGVGIATSTPNSGTLTVQ
ncbi:MAG: hypothetical protein AAB602_03280, partial [Patescibacteria group bacterium]